MSKQATITLQKLNECSSVYTALELAKDIQPDYPSRPAKPFLKTPHTTEEVLEYAEKLKDYEKLKDLYEKDKEFYNEESLKHNFIVETYIKDKACLDAIPKQYQSKVYAKAYDDGHSDGWYSIYQKLTSLIEIFE